MSRAAHPDSHALKLTKFQTAQLRERGHATLTTRQAAALYSLGIGETAADHARRLGCSVHTVNDWRRGAVAAMGARNAYEAVAIWYRQLA